MTIILVEVNTSDSKPERTFNTALVRVGRDVGENDIAFDRAKYPMVSRRHAEFRCEGGDWLVADLESSYGVFVNGQKVNGRQKIAAGNKVQFGTDGPTMVVIWCEAAGVAQPTPEKPKPAAPRPAAAAPPIVQAPPVQHAPAKSQSHRKSESWEVGPPPVKPHVRKPTSSLELEPDAYKSDGSLPKAAIVFVDTPARPPFSLPHATISIGRDPGCNIVIDSTAAMVSRKHVEVGFDGREFVLRDNQSFNGTLVNEQRVAAATPLYHGDTIRLGAGGPVLRFDAPTRNVPTGASLPGQRAVATGHAGNAANAAGAGAAGNVSPTPGSNTMVVDRKSAERHLPKNLPVRPQLLMSVVFGGKSELTIGRSERSDIKLEGLQISNRHARLVRTAGGVAIEDLKSTNGVYINGRRVDKEQLGPGDSAQIGAFLISADSYGNINVYDTRSRTRLDVVSVTRQVKDGSAGQITLLDSISLSIQPNEFVGVLGPSGAGKSILMEVMNGIRPATGGSVLVNNIDLHRHHDSLKQSIGYVPQEDIIHRELTVHRTLHYVAKMRLSRDVSSAEVREIVDEILDVTGLTEKRNVRVSELSGGQRKRVSIAVELITKPSIIFLDEPTSGLDPGAEERIMKLFRQIAEAGRTVILTTHSMENVRLFDKIVVLMGGKLVFYGKPDEALAYMKASTFKELYERLEQPVTDGVREHGEGQRLWLTQQAAETWKTKFRSTPQYQQYIQKPLGELGAMPAAGRQKKSRLGIFGGVRQWATLSTRYLEVLFKDKLTLFILLAQAPIIALMTLLVIGPKQPRDFVYFVLAIVAVWFGTSVSAREIIRERAVYKRERMVNLGLVPYLASKLFVIGIIVALQCLMLFVPLKIFDLAGVMTMPGELFGIPQLWVMLLTGAVGVGLGLFVSALVRTSEMATGMVPLILIPQLLFAGLAGVPASAATKTVSMTMPAAWSFDTIKRFSTLDTLEAEGANPNGKTKGLGLYKYVEAENERIVAKAKQDFEDYKRASESSFQDAPESVPDLSSTSIKKVPDDLSNYVTFLHPWMPFEVLNQLVLMLMFGGLVIATLIVLRLKDS